MGDLLRPPRSDHFFSAAPMVANATKGNCHIRPFGCSDGTRDPRLLFAIGGMARLHAFSRLHPVAGGDFQRSNSIVFSKARSRCYELQAEFCYSPHRESPKFTPLGKD